MQDSGSCTGTCPCSRHLPLQRCTAVLETPLRRRFRNHKQPLETRKSNPWPFGVPRRWGEPPHTLPADQGCESCCQSALPVFLLQAAQQKSFTWVVVAFQGHCFSRVSSFSLLFQKLWLPSAATHSPTQETSNCERQRLSSGHTDSER